MKRVLSKITSGFDSSKTSSCGRHQSLIFYAGLFLLTSFYVMSQAVDVYVFHFFVDIYLARIAMAIMAIGLALMLGRELLRHIGALKSLIILIAGWCLYLMINAVLSANPAASFKLLVRFIGAWIIALEIGILIHGRGAKSMYVIGSALLFTLLLMLFAVHFQAAHSSYSKWLQAGLRNYHVSDPSRLQAFYVNPNTLGIVLVLHAAASIWFTFHKYVSLAILPGVWTIAVSSILQTQSRSSVVGISSVGLFAICAYYRLFLSETPVKAKLVPAMIVLCVILLGATLIPHQKFRRFSPALSKVSAVGWADLASGKVIERLATIDPARTQIWKRAHAYWKSRPWTGVGLGAFQHMPKETMFHAHDFILNILVEQGIVGLTFLIAFFCLLVYEAKSWASFFLLLTVPFSQLFDDLTLCVAFPIYTSLILGYCFGEVLRHAEARRRRVAGRGDGGRGEGETGRDGDAVRRVMGGALGAGI